MKKEYIQHLAKFYFKPKYDWGIEDALKLYQNSQSSEYDKIIINDCIPEMKKIPENSIDVVFADPPFGINFSGKESLYNRKSSNVIEGYHEIAPEFYLEFSIDWIEQAYRVLRDTGNCFIMSGETQLSNVLKAIEKTPFTIKNIIVFHYPFGTYCKKKFVVSHYHLLYLVKNPKKYFFNTIEHYVDDVWEYNRPYSKNEPKNGTKLPLELVQRCIDFTSKPGDIILDPFLGSGTTAFVAKKHFRHYIGIEFNLNMKKYITNKLNKITPGEDYTSYISRLPTIDELSLLYPNAYKKYCELELQKD